MGAIPRPSGPHPYPCRPTAKARQPRLLPLPPPLPRSPRRAWGADATDCRTRAREKARSPLPPPAAPACTRGPDPRPPAGLSRPFRCSSQDGGRASRAAPRAPVSPLPFSNTAAGSEAVGGAAPHPAARQWRGRHNPRGPEQLPRGPAGCQVGSDGRGGPDAIRRIPRVPLDFRGWTRPQDSRVWTFLSNPERVEGIPLHPPVLFQGRIRPPGRGSQPPLPPKGLRGLEVTRSAARDAKLGAAAASPGGGGSSSPGSCLPAPAVPAASSLPSPRRDTYRGRAAPRGRAGRRRRGPASLGPWPAEEGAAGGSGRRRLDPRLGLVTSNFRWPWAPGCLC